MYPVAFLKLDVDISWALHTAHPYKSGPDFNLPKVLFFV
jgi:hypothetical protein